MAYLCAGGRNCRRFPYPRGIVGGYAMSLFRPTASSARALTAAAIPWNVDTPGLTLNGNLTSGLRLVPLYAATSMITDSISTCPLHAYQGNGTGRQLVPSQPKLVAQPGPNGLDIVAWLAQATMSMLLRGNAYGMVTHYNGMDADTVKWFHPDTVTVDETSEQYPIYRVNGREIPAPLVVHIAGIAPPGSVVGLSPVQLFRAQIETGLRAGALARNWYHEGVAPQAILYNKTRALEPGEAQTAKALLKEAVADRDVLVTGNDWGWLPLSVSPSDAQFLEQIQATATEFAAVYHVAPEDIGGTSGQSMTYSTLESNDLRYTRRACLPTFTRIEHALNRLLPFGQYAKFNLDALARAELKSRMESHAIALDNGILTQAEVRALEDKAPLTAAELEDWQNYYVVPRPQTIVATKGAQ